MLASAIVWIRLTQKVGGVVVTNGAGSSQIGPCASCTDEQMQDVRREEQRATARLGRYAI